MKAYLGTTATLFGLMVLLHVYRASMETQLLRDPWYYLITVVALGLAVWGFTLLRRPKTE